MLTILSLLSNNLVGEESKLPIIFSKHYNITLGGLQRLHPFDTEKYGKVYNYLVEKVGIKESQFYVPPIVSEEDLLSVHTQEYLSSLKQSKNIAKIVEVGILALVPNTILQNSILRPMKYATGGTILGCKLALKYGWAINLSGGYHHAKANSGGGFCIFADIPIAVYKLLNENPQLCILIVDLDAHQGNGYESIFKDDPRVHIFDVYNEDIYPNDYEAKKYIEFDYPLKSYVKDNEYLSLIIQELPKAISKTNPNLIIYNAGTDIFEEDPLGCMSISEAGILKRDEIVFKLAFENKVPIIMLLSGGYTQKSATIIGKSIENILNLIP
jgi:histone deacetylase 11